MSTPIRGGFTAKFYSDAPTLQDADGTRHWVTRAANFVVVATQAVVGAQLRRSAADQSDEYLLLLPEDTGARVEAGGEQIASAGDSLTVVPPGDSTVTATTAGWIYRIFSQLAADWLPLAPNHAVYANGGAPEVAPLETWPAPVGGYRLRHYPLANYARSDNTMRLFRTCNLMVNIFLPGTAARDPQKMTPHSHTDFEQGSLALRGGWIHHMRYPWVPDMTTWREDEHNGINSPSLIVIPPNVIHTSQSLGEPGMRLVDIFAPPRDDFSLKPGLVNNADEYPLPERLQGVAPAANAG